jgi:dUTP pyrophosphatase
MNLEVKLNNGALPPKRGSEFAAGYDLFSNESKIIEPGDRALVCTGLQISFPEGHYARIASRSGLACKFGIDVGAGVVDFDYKGLVKVLLINNGKEPFIVNKHERIAQLVLEKISHPEIVVVDNLNATKRGDGGFGSTGSK